MTYADFGKWLDFVSYSLSVLAICFIVLSVFVLRSPMQHDKLSAWLRARATYLRRRAKELSRLQELRAKDMEAILVMYQTQNQDGVPVDMRFSYADYVAEIAED